MVAFGLPPEDALAAITVSAYTYLGRPEPLRPGASADVVCVDGDPREDISVLQRPAFVMRRGVEIRSAEIEGS